MTAQLLSDLDPDDPSAILAALPEDHRAMFLAEYAEALDKAREPKNYPEFRAMLHRWRLHAFACNQPGYAESLAAMKSGTATFIPAEDVIPGWPVR